MPHLPDHILRRAATAALLALAAMAALVPGGASAATPATMRLLGSDPHYGRVMVTLPGGATVGSSPGWFDLAVTTADGTVERRGFCADALHHIATGTSYSVSLRTAADDPSLASPAAGETAWLLQRADDLIAAAPAAARPLEAGALQVAVWQLTGQAREAAPTDDAVLNARAAALRAVAAGRRVGGPVAVAAAATRGCAGEGAIPLTLTGVPGSTAQIAISTGAGTLSASSVRFAADGTATATVSAATANAVTVTVTSAGGTLTRIARATGSQTTPQETVVLVPRQYSASTTVNFDDCAPADTRVVPFGGPALPATPVRGAAPGPPAAPARPAGLRRFSLLKTGPRRAMAGSLIRYRIRVVNTGSEDLAGLTVADDLPRGMSLAAMPARASLHRGRLVWRIPSLRAGMARTLVVRARIDADAVGVRCNRATGRASGPGAPGTSRRSSACTRIVPATYPMLPAVTA